MSVDLDTHTPFYQILELPLGSSPEEIHAQYRKLAKQYHPDRNPERREWAEEQQRRLNEAYYVLSHADAEPPGVSASPPPIAVTRNLPAQRLLRYALVVGVICAVSVVYTSLSQPLPNTGHLPIVMQRPPEVSNVPAVPPPAPLPSQDTLAAEFQQVNGSIDLTLAQASTYLQAYQKKLADGSDGHPQKTEQLESDTLQLQHLQNTVRDGLNKWQNDIPPEMRQIRAADLRLALHQMLLQQKLLRHDLLAFAGSVPVSGLTSSPSGEYNERKSVLVK